MNKQNKTFVISLGGSVMVPDEIDEKFLKNFKTFILKKVKNGYKFLIITGGGKICRKYQQASQNISKASITQKDWLGIEVTKLNALLLKIILGKISHPTLLDSRKKIIGFGKYSVILGCGWVPGSSSDLDTIKTAIDFKTKTVINLGKPAYVYTSNPDKDPSAKPIIKITWKDYFKIIPKKWTPGMNAPFDPIAAKVAMKNKIKVIVANGRNLANLEKIMAGKDFQGTTIY